MAIQLDFYSKAKKEICVFPVTRPTLFFVLPNFRAYAFFDDFRKNTFFFRNRLFYYKIVMAAHLLAARSLLTVRINKCQHLVVDKNAIVCIENRRTLLDIFTDNHGELPKGFQLTVTCNTSTDTAKGTSFDVQPNMLVGDLVGTFNIKRLEFSCTKEQQTTLNEIVNNAALANKAIDAFQILMAGGRKKVSLKTSRYVLKERCIIHGMYT